MQFTSVCLVIKTLVMAFGINMMSCGVDRMSCDGSSTLCVMLMERHVVFRV